MAELCLLFLVAVVFSVAFHTTDGCQCMGYDHPQEAFCNAHLVIKAKVLTFTPYQYTSDDYTDYEDSMAGLEILDVFKNEANIDIKTKPFVLYIPPWGGSCGFRVTPGSEQLFSVHIEFGRPYTNMCRYNPLWEDVSKSVKANFEAGIYKEACQKCKVVSCRSCISDDSTCKWNGKYQNTDCINNDLCITQKSGKCGWGMYGVCEGLPPTPPASYEDSLYEDSSYEDSSYEDSSYEDSEKK